MNHTFYVVVSKAGKYLAYGGDSWVDKIENAKEYTTLRTAKSMFTYNLNQFNVTKNNLKWKPDPLDEPDHIEEWVKISSKVKDV